MLRHAPDPAPAVCVRVELDGQLYQRIGFDTMLLLERDLHLHLTAPPGHPEWAVVHCSDVRLAAWREVVR